MDISSTNSIPLQPSPTTVTPNRAEDKVEGNTPDNDGDKDDIVSQATQVTNATGSVGTQINITV